MKSFYNEKKQQIGILDDKGIFRKKIKGSKHILRKLNAIGISQSVINEIKNDCKELRVLDEETDKFYKSSMENFLQNSVAMAYEDIQLFLPLSKWEKLDKITTKIK